MRDATSGGDFYDASNQATLQHQYSDNLFYAATASPAANEASSSNFSSYDGGGGVDLHFKTPQQELPSTYIQQQRQQTLISSLPQGSRHTLPSNLNSFYSVASPPNPQAGHRIASCPSTAYTSHLSSHFNGLTNEAADWFAAPQSYRSSTISNSSFSTSAARNSGTSFATTISTRSSLVSNDTYTPANYDAYPSVYVGSNDASQPAVAAVPALPEGSVSDPGRPFQCTYHCGKTFAKRHEWKRHEDSIHESQWKYICKPEIIYPGMHCQFCQCIADQAHFELNHQNRLCQELDDKCKHSFTRKDKFQLHVQNRHCPNSKSKKQWQKWAHPTDPRPEGYGCGFCNESLPSWNTRAKHIGDHFEKDAPRFTIDRWDKSYDVGMYGRDNASQTSRYSSQTNSQHTDFYAESKALSDGESQAHTPPDSRNRVPIKRNISKATCNGNRQFYEEENTYMEDDPGGDTLFGDETDYVE